MMKLVREFSFAGTILWMMLAAVVCWSQSPLTLSIILAAGGALCGSMLSYLARESRISLWRTWIAGFAAMVLVNSLIDLARWAKLPSFILGGPGAYLLTDALFWGAEVTLVVFLLRWSSTVKPSLISLELLVAGGALAELFAAHRNGYVNRPYAIVDPLWARGIDPLPVFLAFGALIAALLLVLGATHSPKRGRWVDVVALLAVVGCLFLFAPLEKLNDLPKPAELMQGQDDSQAKRGGGGQTGGRLPRSGAGQGGESQGGESPGGDQTGNESQGGKGTKGQAGPNQGEGQQGQSGQSQGGDSQGQGGQNSGQGGQNQGDGQQQGQSGQSEGQGGQNGQNQGGGQNQGQGGENQGGGDQSQGGQNENRDGQQQGEANDDQGQAGQRSPHDKSPNAGQGGDSDELSFKDNSNDSPNENPPIAVVVFRDDYTPDTGMYYFRQEAFSQYNGTKMVFDTSGKYDRDVAIRFPGREPEKPQVPPLEKGLFRELETRVALITDHAKPFALVNPTEWRSTANPDPKRFQKAFDVKSLVLDKPINEVIGRPAGEADWSVETWKHYTEGPDDPRYPKLLEEITAAFPDADASDPLIRALMVKLWLEENGVYSLKSRHEGAADPTADFLFGDRTGYCVFFAHAAVYLYRTAGMPARVGSGYAVEASQRGNGSALLIPAKSAHSWPEVYIRGMGWVVLDIAPQRSLDPPVPQNDPGLQQMMGEMARQDPEEEEPDPIEEKIDVQEMLQGMARALAAGVPWMLLLALLAAYGYKIYRRYQPHLCPEQDLPQATLRSLLDLLSDAGFDRAEGEPREAFARRVAELSPSFHRLTAAHLRCRLGNPQTAPNFPWKKTFLDARAEIRSGADTARLLRGLLNPITWMKVH